MDLVDDFWSASEQGRTETTSANEPASRSLLHRSSLSPTQRRSNGIARLSVRYLSTRPREGGLPNRWYRREAVLNGSRILSVRNFYILGQPEGREH